ncbi:hypothetical protein P7K49_014929 [Saguinus oedipus]|uniref:Uncharacterized protein n=1 Tax=Saguinus oedipus TaxID=9490 RepID=A0ABQ9V896_SAGOE|nr:hypothetical protein P7K49_014929 [Saguinus oedipus]
MNVASFERQIRASEPVLTLDRLTTLFHLGVTTAVSLFLVCGTFCSYTVWGGKWHRSAPFSPAVSQRDKRRVWALPAALRGCVPRRPGCLKEVPCAKAQERLARPRATAGPVSPVSPRAPSPFQSMKIDMPLLIRQPPMHLVEPADFGLLPAGAMGNSPRCHKSLRNRNQCTNAQCPFPLQFLSTKIKALDIFKIAKALNPLEEVVGPHTLPVVPTFSHNQRLFAIAIYASDCLDNFYYWRKQ